MSTSGRSRTQTQHHTQLASFARAVSLRNIGANLAMADGSVHFLMENTDQVVHEPLSAISGEELAVVP